ncbi:MAG: hypothetical protein Q4D04_03470, partial [Clostridia bacterium]|nr:hypothetical protein [Clostridia bacterium]
VRLRGLLAAAFMTVCLLSGALSLVREGISSYVLFTPSEAAAAEFIEENLPMDSVFLTGTQHNNAVAALTGRKIVCGSPSYLYYHGVDYSDREDAVAEMYEFPAESAELFEIYDVDYIYLSANEQYNFDVDITGLYAMGEVVYENDFVTIIDVTEYGDGRGEEQT